MTHLLKIWELLEKRLRGKNIFLFFDYDGTLVPIVERPEDAVLAPSTKDLLVRLAAFKNCKLAIISGRALENVMGMVGIAGIVYAGNHGLEMAGTTEKFANPTPQGIRLIMGGLRDELNDKLSSVSGVRVEDKGLTLSLHYRQATKEDVPRIKDVFQSVVNRSRLRKQTRVVAGKKVFEVRPGVRWDKGAAILWLLEHEAFRDGRKPVAMYLGDDITDEDAFRVLKGADFPIWVGEGEKTYARYFLKNSDEVFEFLNRMVSLVGD